ncbi:type I pantothenate kinase [Alicyclobacillus sp. SO9]|uniref:type I pantothenate kinase n=1 Tax=Alicyclobacillus sp. SO9 TaxID=2665646 RepID=UPI0018E7CF06|nr:type I pantothenate kinase [Alicyclobacillus sp. SO9]QQE81048.1 type I pantothenate kinase [Alicyclobacillus sp. SO9]
METSFTSEISYSPYIRFSREQWSGLRATTPLPMSEEELEVLRGVNEQVSLREVSEAYLPLSRLLNLYVAKKQELYRVTSAFHGNHTRQVPYIIGIAGSVAVGKSTTARIIQALLARWPNHPTVDLIATDGFLYPNRVLKERGLMKRKGFPESYDRRRLIRFLADVKSGKPEVYAPVYSHLTYDIVSGEVQTIRQPDIVIVEGLTVLQTSGDFGALSVPRMFVSDFFDFSIYVDANEADIQQWYKERFLTLRETAFRDKNSYFHQYASLAKDKAEEVAQQIWEEINQPNLRENIEPTKFRAHLILEKGRDHSVQQVNLRKL